MKKYLSTFAGMLLACVLHAVDAATLVGWADMLMHTYSEGPTEGQFNGGGEVATDKQIIQGFSAVLKSDQDNQFYFLTDNGFGEKDNSADALIRLYEVNIDFNTVIKKDDSVAASRYLNVKDPERKLSFKIQADYSHYYNEVSKPEVNKGIIENRWLTGADIDPESVRIDKNGKLWLGDEFGPFLINIDASGKVLRQEIPLPDVMSPDNPNRNNLPANLPSTGGFEGMAINPAGDTLYPMLESTVQGDAEKCLRIYQFDINTAHYSKEFYRYHLNEGTSIGDFVAVNEHEFLVVERNAATAISDKPFKKIYLIDINQIDNAQFVHKQELVDLMQIQDPDDLNEDNQKTYAFAYSHIENLLIIDKNTLLIANDNNDIGRTYFIKIKLDNSLRLANFTQPNINKNAWINNNIKPTGFDFGDHTLFGWATVLMYFLATFRTGYQAKIANKNKESSYFWLGLTVLLVFLGLNKQLDLQTNLTELLRATSKAHGWYEQRRGVQLLFISLMGLAIPLMLISLRVFLFNSWRRYKLTWVGIVLLLVFISVRAASFHHVDLFFYKTIGNMRYYQALEMLAIGVVILGTFYENKSVELNQNNKVAIKDFVEIRQEGESIVCPKCYKRPAAEAKDGRTFKCKFCKHIYQVQLLQ